MDTSFITKNVLQINIYPNRYLQEKRKILWCDHGHPDKLHSLFGCCILALLKSKQYLVVKMPKIGDFDDKVTSIVRTRSSADEISETIINAIFMYIHDNPTIIINSPPYLKFVSRFWLSFEALGIMIPINEY